MRRIRCYVHAARAALLKACGAPPTPARAAAARATRLAPRAARRAFNIREQVDAFLGRPGSVLSVRAGAADPGRITVQFTTPRRVRTRAARRRASAACAACTHEPPCALVLQPLPVVCEPPTCAQASLC